MSELNPIIYQIKRNQQEMNNNNISTISLNSNLMDPAFNNISTITADINDFKEIDPKYLYILLPSKKNVDKKKYTYLGLYDNKHLYIKNDLIYYTFPSNIDDINNLSNYIHQLIENNPYLLEIKLPKIYGNIGIPSFIQYETNEFYVYYKIYIEIYSLYKPNIPPIELNKIIEIFKICQPLQLYIHHSNTKNMEVFLNQYYIHHTNINNNSNFDYFTINSYIIPNNLTEEDFNYLIHILLEIKPNELYIPNKQYIYNFDSSYNSLLSPLLDFYAKKNYNINGNSYYEKRNV